MFFLTLIYRNLFIHQSSLLFLFFLLLNLITSYLFLSRLYSYLLPVSLL
nr:MAG TPA: hypothetical protein [Caudoviricetes sp.]